ncbi:MAG: hypothetical protein HQM09_18405 [Candidatus Riflebacteria bacterium]|nr:hypothetical protein [Candidatus Riflebacteria bacterium]
MNKKSPQCFPMSKWQKLLTVLAVMITSIAFGFTVDEIRQLQQMGFSNQQIMELQKNHTGTSVAAVGCDLGSTASAASAASPMQQFRERGTGLLVICFSKEWVQRGPGFLYFDRKAADGKWIPMGQARVLDYTGTGEFGPPLIEHISKVVKREKHEEKEHKKDGHATKDEKKDGHAPIVEREIIREETIIHPRELITSRYYVEFELSPGQYELQAERLFFTGDNEESGLIKVRRHRNIKGVPITAGNVTILSYQWNENEKFGLDHPVSQRHKNWVDSIAAKFGALIADVKM